MLLTSLVQNNSDVSGAETGAEAGEGYLALANYSGEHEEDISFPKGETVEVLEKNSIGWWVVR